MSSWQAKYSDQQKRAVAEARLDRGISGPRIVELAKTGALVLDGKALEPFAVNPHTVYTIAQNEQRKRHGTTKAALAAVDHEDALDALRRRLIAAADYDLRGYERAQRKGNADPERLRQIIRCVREAAALPGPKEGRGVKPGQRDPHTGTHDNGGATRGGLPGQILSSHRRALEDTEQDGPAPERPFSPLTPAENGDSSAAADASQSAVDEGQSEAPGSSESRAGTRRSPLLASVTER